MYKYVSTLHEIPCAAVLKTSNFDGWALEVFRRLNLPKYAHFLLTGRLRLAGGGGGGVSLATPFLPGVTGGESSLAGGLLEYRSSTLWQISVKSTHIKRRSQK